MEGGGSVYKREPQRYPRPTLLPQTYQEKISTKPNDEKYQQDGAEWNPRSRGGRFTPIAVVGEDLHWRSAPALESKNHSFYQIPNTKRLIHRVKTPLAINLASRQLLGWIQPHRQRHSSINSSFIHSQVRRSNDQFTWLQLCKQRCACKPLQVSPRS